MVTEVIEPPTTQHSNGTIRCTHSNLMKTSHQEISWKYIFFYTYFHAAAMYTLAQFPPHLYTVLINVVLHVWACFSITVGCHRLWSHKSYKAKWPLRLFLAIGQGVAFQFSIYKWVWMHRLHHKFTDTDADPHNSKRGFFFSHVGWIMHQQHEQVLIKKETIDFSDLEEDWIVMWQHKCFRVVGPLSCFILPTIIPFLCWNEDLITAWHFSILKYLTSLHSIFLVNSAAHMWGTRSYDSHISPSNNVLISLLTFGEGSHNYHHVFPWDYKTAESKSYLFNISLLLLDLFGKLGLAHDFKEASHEMIQKRKLRTGITDWSQSSEPQVWGLEDEDMDEQEKMMITCGNPTETKKSC